MNKDRFYMSLTFTAMYMYKWDKLWHFKHTESQNSNVFSEMKMNEWNNPWDLEIIVVLNDRSVCVSVTAEEVVFLSDIY